MRESLATTTGSHRASGWNRFVRGCRSTKWLMGLPLSFCAACATLDVKTEHGPSVDFSRYQTFAFADPAEIGEERTADEALLKDQIEPAISQQLRARGLREGDPDHQADLSVYYWVNVTATKMRVWRSGYGRGPKYGGTGPKPSYREGTLVLDLVEAAQNNLVWRATVIAPLKETRTQNLDLAIQAVGEAFRDYPPGDRPR